MDAMAQIILIAVLQLVTLYSVWFTGLKTWAKLKKEKEKILCTEPSYLLIVMFIPTLALF